jgi:hypothetical protein
MGVGQLVAGGLLLLRRTAAAGTLAALPVTAGVLATLWALPFHAADRVAGAILAVMLVSLVAWEYPRWAPLFGAAPEGEIALAALSPGWRRAGVGAAAVAAVGLCGIALWHAVLRHR